MHRSTIILPLLLFGILLLCSGCLTLGQHETKFTASPDSLEIDFDGVLLVDEVCLNTNERKDTQSAMNGWEHKIRKRLIAEGATYSLDANSDGSIDLEINLKRRYRDFNNNNLLEFYSFQYLGDGVFELNSKRDRRNRLDYLAKGFSESDFRNTIAFRPLEGVNVLKHNADSKPGILARSYTWDNPQASDDGMSITFEIPAIKEAIAEARAKRERERKAEEQRRKAEMMARLDQYAQQLAEHRKQVITGPKKALETWREFKIELTNPKITFLPNAVGTQQAEFSCKVFIQNTGDQSVVLSNGLIIVIRTPDGRRTMNFPTLEAGKRSFDSFQPGASRTLELRTSLATGEQARLLADLTRGGQCSVGIRPTRLKIYENGRNRGDLTPDGAAFVCPEPPALQMQAADREEKQRWIKYIEARVRAAGAPAADAEVPVLPAETFDSPLVWYTLTAENQLPAVD